MSDVPLDPEPRQSEPQHRDTSAQPRRNFLEWLLGVVVAVSALTFVAPMVAYLSPRRTRKGTNVLMGSDGRPVPYKELNTNPVVAGVGVNGEPTLVVKYSGEVRAFSAVCTHLGCLVKWNAAKSEFLCPCHGGVFDANGVNVSGPPPKPLKRYKVFATAEGEIGLEEVRA